MSAAGMSTIVLKLIGVRFRASTRRIDTTVSFIDRELLEGKLPDTFEDVRLFQKIIAESKTFKE